MKSLAKKYYLSADRKSVIDGFKRCFQAELSKYYTGISLEIHPTPDGLKRTLSKLSSAEKNNVQGVALQWGYISGADGAASLVNYVSNELQNVETIVLSHDKEQIAEALRYGASQVVNYVFTSVDDLSTNQTVFDNLADLNLTILHALDRRNSELYLLRQRKELPLDLLEAPDNRRILKEDTQNITSLIKDLSDLVEVVRSDNSLFSDVLRAQLIAALKRLLVSLEAHSLPTKSSSDDATLISQVGKRVQNEALSKGVGTIFKRAANGIFDLLTGGSGV